MSDSDRLDEKIRHVNDLPLLKLHGCITRTEDHKLPLILTVDQYNTHRQTRDTLFRTFTDWLFRYPVVFVGHRLQDADIRAVLQEASITPELRPRSFLVRPGVDELEQRFWESRRLTVLRGEFKDFLSALDRAIPPPLRPLLAVVEPDIPIRTRFIVDEPVGEPVGSYLLNDVQYVTESVPLGDGDAGMFYKGFDLFWLPIVNGWDVRRGLTDTILNDVIVQQPVADPNAAEFYVILAEAGAGKSVLLRRIAWETARDGGFLCLFASPNATHHIEPIRELHRKTGERIFLFIDNATDHVGDIVDLLEGARRSRVPLTILSAERTNEWNMRGADLQSYLTDTFWLRYLSRVEIEHLVRLLGEHDSLGPNLKHKAFEAQVEEFHERAGRQLLVALHEATTGEPFEAILVDEYHEIQPDTARLLYLTVCVLNRLRIPVRAGLIARVHGLSFEHFRQDLFAPLEHVVTATEHRATGDYMYVARHPEIAQIVFQRILIAPADRFNQYIRIIDELNLAYNADREAFRGLMRAKSLTELFPNSADVYALFNAASKVGTNEAYLYQQMANYERLREDGDLGRARDRLAQAKQLDPRDSTVTHTLAEVLRSMSLLEAHRLERIRLRREARQLLAGIYDKPETGRYARVTQVKVALDELREILQDPGASDRVIDEAIRAAENPLQSALQQYPNDRYLLIEEAALRGLLDDYERAFRALKRAFEANPRDPYIAVRLARAYEAMEDLEAARETLHAALSANRGDKQLNFRYAMVLRRLGADDADTLMYHLLRAFTEWDKNFEAQFWYGRYAFFSEDERHRARARDIFARLRQTPMQHDVRHQLRDFLTDDQGKKQYSGSVARVEGTYAFVQRDGAGDELFFHMNQTDAGIFEQLRSGLRVSFEIGFAYAGPKAVNVGLIT